MKTMQFVVCSVLLVSGVGSIHAMRLEAQPDESVGVMQLSAVDLEAAEPVVAEEVVLEREPDSLDEEAFGVMAMPMDAEIDQVSTVDEKNIDPTSSVVIADNYQEDTLPADATLFTEEVVQGEEEIPVISTTLVHEEISEGEDSISGKENAELKNIFESMTCEDVGEEFSV